MLFRLLIFANVLALCSLAAEARSPEGIFEGELGDKRVVVELFSFDQGHFFVAGVGEDHWFAMQASGDSLVLEEREQDNDGKVKATWRLRRSDTGWLGERQEAGSARPAPVTLRQILHRPEYPDVPFSREDRPYQFRRIESLSRLESLPPQARATDLGYELVVERRTGIIRPRLVRLANPDLLPAVNRILEDQQYTAAWDAWFCGQQQRYAAHKRGEPIPTRVPYEQNDVRVTYLSATLMSYVATIRKSCDAFGDGLHINAFNIDLTKAKRLASFLPWWPMPPGTNPYDGEFLDLEEPRRIRSFNSLWFTQLKSTAHQYLASRDRNVDTDACARAIQDSSFQERSIGNLAYFTNEGLAIHVMGSWPQPGDACLLHYPPNPVIIGYAQLAPFLKRDHPFAELRR